MRDLPGRIRLWFKLKWIAPLLGASMFLFCVWGFLELAEDVPEGRFKRSDELILRSLRDAAHPEKPIGPGWLKDTMRDVSALGSEVVLTFAVASVVIYLLLLRRPHRAGVVALASAGGALLNSGLKSLAARPRPEVVPHLTEVISSSFPSGHSMVSAIVYLTLGVLLAKREPKRLVQIYLIVLACILSIGVGFSRVYLGVHYPTDVLAGWAAGTAWALLWAALERLFFWKWPKERA